jgi:hypothetical protein
MRSPFSKPIARIYVSELRTSLDSTVVPIFTPDTAIEVGDVGSFDDGRFVRKASVKDRGLSFDIDENPVNAYEYASSGKVSFGPSAKIPNPMGGELLKAVVSFTKAKAVVVSFRGGVQQSVRDADAFSDGLMQLWYRKELRTDRVVVWSVRRATSGTVLVSEDGGNQVEVMADSALLGPAGITLAGLSVGVQFGAERKATWKMPPGDAPLVVWARILGLSKDQASVVDEFGFESDTRPGGPAIAPVAFTADDLIEELD